MTGGACSDFGTSWDSPFQQMPVRSTLTVSSKDFQAPKIWKNRTNRYTGARALEGNPPIRIFHIGEVG